MWNQIRSFIIWLHRPDHVARFQNYFGVLPIELDESNSTSNFNQVHQNNYYTSKTQTQVPNGLHHHHHQSEWSYMVCKYL